MSLVKQLRNAKYLETVNECGIHMKTKVFLFQLSYSDLPGRHSLSKGTHGDRCIQDLFFLCYVRLANELHITITAYLPLP